MRTNRVTGRPLCREPWQNYYILRRGILPCCFGHAPIAPMADYATAWNSPAMREIRQYLAKGEPGPYCLQSKSCPIVQRYLAERTKQADAETAGLPRVLRAINRLRRGVARKWRRP